MQSIGVSLLRTATEGRLCTLPTRGRDETARRMRRSYFALDPVVFFAASTNLSVYVLVTSILALATSGDERLNTASTASAPFGSILPVGEYIGIVFFSAAR